MELITTFINQHSAIIKIGFLFLLGVIISLFEYFVYKYYLPHITEKKRLWRRILLQSLHGPLLSYVWVIVISFVLSTLFGFIGFTEKHIALIDPARRILTTLFLLWFVMRLIGHWEQHSVETIRNGRNKIFRDPTSVHAVAQLLRFSSILILVLTLLSVVGLPISTLLTFGGIGGLAISFAAKDTLANFLGGLMIYWDRPFSVGDWIRSPDKNIEGTVLNIGWRLTKIRTFDKRPLYVPNGVFSTISVENPQRMSNRRIKTLIGIRYEDAAKVSVIVSEIKKMLEDDNDIDKTQTWFVNLVEFGASALNISVYTFTKTTDWVKFQTVRQNIYLKIIAIVTRNGAEFAYPTETLHISDNSENFKKLKKD